MKNKALLMIIAVSAMFVSSCGVFQKVEKHKEDYASTVDSSVVTTYNSVDTSVYYTKKTWFGITPQLEAAVLKSFEASFAANSAIAAANLKGSTLEMGSAVQNMSDANVNLLQMLQKNGIGYEESVFDRKGQSNSGTQEESLKKTEESSSTDKLKEPDKSALVIFGVLFIVCQVITVIAGLWFARRITKKVSGLSGIFEKNINA